LVTFETLLGIDSHIIRSPINLGFSNSVAHAGWRAAWSIPAESIYKLDIPSDHIYITLEALSSLQAVQQDAHSSH